MDENLTWSSHVSTQCTKALSALRYLYANTSRKRLNSILSVTLSYLFSITVM